MKEFVGMTYETIYGDHSGRRFTVIDQRGSRIVVSDGKTRSRSIPTRNLPPFGKKEPAHNPFRGEETFEGFTRHFIPIGKTEKRYRQIASIPTTLFQTQIPGFVVLNYGTTNWQTTGKIEAAEAKMRIDLISFLKTGGTGIIGNIEPTVVERQRARRISRYFQPKK